VSTSTAAADRPHNLPAHLPSIIGREEALKALRERLLQEGDGLLTLTGAGGSGKTRLALAVAAAVLDRAAFPDGVWVADLAPLSEPLLVPGAVAASIGVQEQPGRPIRDTLLDALRSRCMLLVLDNCEHLVEACASLADDVLRACPNVRILATSREPLRLPVERIWRVPPLPAPDPSQAVRLDELSANPAVRLFVERAQAVEPSFALSQETSPAVVGICARLDGLPLAIELAAARVRVLTPEQVLTRLDDAFGLLVGASRAAPARHQTLRTTLDWSLQLLAPDAQRRFERVAVFAGGFDLEAAAAVWRGPPPLAEDERDALEMLMDLVDRSLVVAQPQSGAMRYRLLEPVRQYAQQRLTERGDWGASQARHAQYFLGLAERGEQGYKGPQQAGWMARLRREHNNLRAALGRCLDAGQAEMALRIASALWQFWRRGGYRHEGQRWLEEGLARSPSAVVAPAVRAKAHEVAGELAYARSTYQEARAHYEAALPLWRGSGDSQGLATTLGYYGRLLTRIARTPEEHQTATAMLEEAVGLCGRLGDQWGVAWALQNLGHAAWENGELERAAHVLADAVGLFHSNGDEHLRQHTRMLLAGVERDQGHLEHGQQLLEACLPHMQQHPCPDGTAGTLYRLARLARDRGNSSLALAQIGESLHLFHQLGMPVEIAQCLELLGGLATDHAQSEQAVRLLAAATSLRAEMGVPVRAIQKAERDRDLAKARAGLGPRRFAAAWSAGQVMSLDQVAEYAPAVEARLVRPESARAEPSPLSRRECEVAMLVARGYTNRQIAKELIISERTADGHIAHILAKLGVATRSQIAVWAVEHAAPLSASES
jgi:predicted ATPase/DNA-binding NarL/FixJ family response regulator